MKRILPATTATLGGLILFVGAILGSGDPPQWWTIGGGILGMLLGFYLLRLSEKQGEISIERHQSAVLAGDAAKRRIDPLNEQDSAG